MREHSTAGIRKEDTLRNKKEEEKNQTERTAKHKSDDIAKGEDTNVTNSKPSESIRLTNDRLINDAPAECLEASQKGSRTDNAIRSLKVSHSNGWLSNEKPDEIIYKVTQTVNDKRTNDKAAYETIEMDDEETSGKLLYHVDETD